MADRSAELLAELLILSGNSGDGPDTGADSRLAEQMALDPPLVLWGVCRAWKLDQTEARSLGELARWLIEHALDVLQWQASPTGPSPLVAAPRADSEPWSGRVGKLLALAELAALLAASKGKAAADEAYLFAMVHDPSEWPAPKSKRSKPDVAKYLPNWLSPEGSGGAARWLAEAEAILSDPGVSAPDDYLPETSSRRAAEGARQWAEPLKSPLVDHLPALAAKLARLRDLENRFQQTLEHEKLEAMAEFAAGAGHEINNPLAIIGGRAQLFLREEADPERRRELASMNAQVRRAHEMIADLRLFARPPTLEPKPIDLAELVDALVDDLHSEAAKKAVSISRSGDEGPISVEADPVQLNVALRALCRNAFEAIGQRGHIEITLTGSQREVQVRVSDDGPGISADQRRHLFDPFYSARQAGRGLGFGLSKCWRIVTDHGGQIDVQSQPGQGARFTITFPREWAG